MFLYLLPSSPNVDAFVKAIYLARRQARAWWHYLWSQQTYLFMLPPVRLQRYARVALLKVYLGEPKVSKSSSRSLLWQNYFRNNKVSFFFISFSHKWTVDFTRGYNDIETAWLQSRCENQVIFDEAKFAQDKAMLFFSLYFFL